MAWVCEVNGSAMIPLIAKYAMSSDNDDSPDMSTIRVRTASERVMRMILDSPFVLTLFVSWWFG